MKLKKTLILIFVSIGLYACSTVKLSYNWADYLLYRKIDNYFDIDDQESFVEKKLDQLHIWHRRKEIPKYIIFLEELKIRVKDGISENDLDWYYKALRGFGRSLARKIAKDSVKFLGSLSEDQISYFEKKLSERNKKKLKIIQKPEKDKLEEILEEIVEDIEGWTGDLTKKQIKIVASTIRIDKKKEMIKYNHKLRSQKRFLRIVKSRKDFQIFREQLHDWFFNYRRFYTKEYAAIVAERRKRTRELILIIDRFATRKQRTNAIKRIDYYIKQIKELEPSKVEG